MKPVKVLKPIRFGLIGTGHVAHYCVEEINRHPDGVVVAACARNAERLATFCKDFAIERSYPSATALFEDDEIDAVYIALPTHLHASLAIQALEAGKHVVLEKPFAMNVAEAEAVVAAADASGRVCMLGMNQRFVEDHQKIRSLVQRGVLGDIYHAKAVWLRRAGIPKLGTWFGHKTLAGHGSLYDIGVHMLDLCLYTMNNFEPISVSGVTYTKFGNRGLGEGGWGYSENEGLVFDVDDFASAFIRFANGATVTLDVAWACHQGDDQPPNVTLYGTEGGATLNPAALFRNDAEGGNDDKNEGGNENKNNDENKEGALVDTLSHEVEFSHCSCFANFINHLQGKEALCVTAQQALVVQTILDGIAQSAATGREVRLQP